MSRPGSRLEKKTSSGGRDVYHHLGLLAKDETGYKNLIKLTTDAHLEGYYYKPRIDKEMLAAHKEGLIAMSGCLASEIPDLIMKDQLDKARDAVDWFKQTLGADNFYLELQNHGIAEQAKVNRHLIQWAKEFGLKLVATNDVHYIEKSHSHAHDCLICIGTQTQLADTKRMRYEPEQFYLRSAEEMKARFAETPEAVQEHAGSGREMQSGNRVRQAALPGFHPPEHFTREGYLRQWLAEGCSAATPFTRRPRARNLSSTALTTRRGCRRIDDRSRECPDELRMQPDAATERSDVAAAVKAVIDRLQARTEGHRENRVHQLLPHRRRFHPLRPRAWALPAWRAVQRRRFARHLSAGNRERGPDPLRPAVRALSESRTRQSAGY